MQSPGHLLCLLFIYSGQIKNKDSYKLKIDRKFFIVSLLLISIDFPLPGQVGALIWEDNFNTGLLDYSKWSYETGTGVNGDWGTGQIDRATSRPLNVSFQNGVPGAEDGCLVITTRKEFFIDRNYTSGRINTAGKASWGPGHRIVARVFPADVKYQGQGFAFWMMPDEIPAGWDYIMWPQGGESDIMEYVGSIPYHNLGSVHYAWFWNNNQYADWNHGHKGAYYSFETSQVPDPPEPGYGGYPPATDDPYAGSSGFHTYGIDWYNDRIEFFIDDNIYHIHYLNDGGGFRVDGQDEFAISTIGGRRVGKSEYSNHFSEWHPFEHKMYAILSAGVGGSNYTYGGAIVPEAVFPCSVYIDWVRVYNLGTNTVENENARDIGLRIYPNPAVASVNIQIEGQRDCDVKIIDMKGSIMMHTTLSRSADLDISKLSTGIYMVLISDGQLSVSRKIIKE